MKSGDSMAFSQFEPHAARHPHPRDERGPAAGYLLLLNWPVSATGGVNEVVLSLAEQLRDQGDYHPAIAVTTWDYSPQPSPVRGIEIVNLRLRAPFVAGRALRSFLSFLSTLPSDVKTFASFLRERRIEVINAHFPDLNVFMPLLLRAMGLFRGKLVLSFHGADIVAIGRMRGLPRAVWRHLITRANLTVACSEAMARSICLFAPTARVTFIHNGMSIRLFEGAARTRQRGHRILHVGKFEHKKAQDILLRAFQILKQSVPDAFLVLVGAPGPELEKVRAQISDLALDHSVEVHVGVPHERMPEIMAGADIFVLPSRAEGFPVVLLEAGALGLPVVTTPVNGIPEMIEHQKTGLVVPVEDPVELERAMRLLLTDTATADRLAQAWHERAVTNWSWDRTCRRYLDAIATSE